MANIASQSAHSRSREGAWIEILAVEAEAAAAFGRSREGAWIEIVPVPVMLVLARSLPRGSVD